MKFPKTAKNNFQIEIRIYGTDPFSCVELLKEFAERASEKDFYVESESGLLKHAGGYIVMQEDPGFIWSGIGSVFHRWLKRKFPGYDPDEAEREEKAK